MKQSCWKKIQFNKGYKINWMKREWGYNRNTTKNPFSPSISSQFWRERILCGTYSFLASLLYFSSPPNRRSSQSLFNFSLPSLSLSYFYPTKQSVNVADASNVIITCGIIKNIERNISMDMKISKNIMNILERVRKIDT